MALLELRNITKDFPGVRALDGVSFTLEKGEIHNNVWDHGALVDAQGRFRITVAAAYIAQSVVNRAIAKPSLFARNGRRTCRSAAFRSWEAKVTVSFSYNDICDSN